MTAPGRELPDEVLVEFSGKRPQRHGVDINGKAKQRRGDSDHIDRVHHRLLLLSVEGVTVCVDL